MASNLTQPGRKVANQILVIQCILAIVSSLVFLLIDIKSSYSAFLGGVICFVPNTVFVTYAYRFGGARAAKQIASSFYKGETLKIVLTALLFAVIFIFIPVSIGALMSTYVICLMAYWTVPFLVK